MEPDTQDQNRAGKNSSTYGIYNHSHALSRRQIADYREYDRLVHIPILTVL